MRHSCRRCKSTNTKALSFSRMSCKNCGNTRSFIASKSAVKKRSFK